MSDDDWIDEIDNVPMALIIDEMMEDHPLTDEEVGPQHRILCRRDPYVSTGRSSSRSAK